MITGPRIRRPSRLERAAITVALSAVVVAIGGLALLIVLLLLQAVGA